MSKEKKKSIKNKIHSRNRNKDRYDLKALLDINPDLNTYVKPNTKGEDSIDFSNPIAIKALNKSLLHYYYHIENWNFSDNNVCPSIPNRADYIHHMADVLMESNFGTLPPGDNIKCFNIGVGASCVYPILGIAEYNWNFIASDIDENSLTSAQAIVNSNESLKNKVDCKLQQNPKDFFYGVINKEEKVDLSICNPPIFASLEIAKKSTEKKNATYHISEIGQELIYDGGEISFLQQLVKESKKFATNCYWFSTLVVKQSNQKGMVEFLKELGATQTKVIPMGIGNKSSQIIAWSFLTKEEQTTWKKTRWTIKK